MVWRHGYAAGLTGYQLKIIQEVITLGVFVAFAWIVLGEKLTWNYAVSFLMILGKLKYADKVELDFNIYKDKYWQSFDRFLPAENTEFAN